MIGGSGAGQDDAPPSHSVAPQALTTQSTTMRMRRVERERATQSIPPNIPPQTMDTGLTEHTAMSKGDHSGSMLHSRTLVPLPIITHVLPGETASSLDTMREAIQNGKLYKNKLHLPNLPESHTATILPTDGNRLSTPTTIKTLPSLRLRGAGLQAPPPPPPIPLLRV